MSRKATGAVYWMKDNAGVFRWHARVQQLDGSRPYDAIETPWALDPTAKDRARAFTAELAAMILRARAVPDDSPLPFGEWLKKLHAYKATRGRSSVGTMKGRAAHFLADLGHKPIVQITRDDIEAIVSKLDDATAKWSKADGRRGEGLSHATAANIWGDLAHAFDEAVNAKDRALRVLTVNPCAGVKGPDAGDDREGPILYSDEIVKLLAGNPLDPGARAVPLYRRRVYAVAIYTGARRSELAALTAADVDLEHGTFTIARQVERTKAKGAEVACTKATKTKRVRKPDIEPALRPLLELLVKEPEGKAGRLLRVPPIEDCAELLRQDLWTVGVRRPDLHTDDAARTRMRFHCLRDTCLTHMAVRGDPLPVIQWRAGHTDYKMTQSYVARGGSRHVGSAGPCHRCHSVWRPRPFDRNRPNRPALLGFSHESKRLW